MHERLTILNNVKYKQISSYYILPKLSYLCCKPNGYPANKNELPKCFIASATTINQHVF